MTRPKKSALPESIPPLDDVYLDLLCGRRPGYERTPEELAELEAAWWAYRDQILAAYGDPERLPWAWFAFEAGAAAPPD